MNLSVGDSEQQCVGETGPTIGSRPQCGSWSRADIEYCFWRKVRTRFYHRRKAGADGRVGRRQPNGQIRERVAFVANPEIAVALLAAVALRQRRSHRGEIGKPDAAEHTIDVSSQEGRQFHVGNRVIANVVYQPGTLCGSS